jgi:hypothetical protein
MLGLLDHRFRGEELNQPEVFAELFDVGTQLLGDAPCGFVTSVAEDLLQFGGLTEVLLIDLLLNDGELELEECTSVPITLIDIEVHCYVP